MATRPWVTPQEVKDYTEIGSIKNRSDAKLEIDIARAEYWVINYCHHDFSDDEKYPVIPTPVKMAVILLAEAYSFNATKIASAGLKSETFDDYSYTASESTLIDLDDVDVSGLLGDFVEGVAINGDTAITMRLRKL